jgi:hypothetical protein
MITPGLQGDYRGTCVVCVKPTDTGLAFIGEAEWVIAGLQVLGVPADQAEGTARQAWREQGRDVDDGNVPDGELTATVRVCRACVRRASGARFPDPVLLVGGAAVPAIRQQPGT